MCWVSAVYSFITTPLICVLGCVSAMNSTATYVAMSWLPGSIFMLTVLPLGLF